MRKPTYPQLFLEDKLAQWENYAGYYKEILKRKKFKQLRSRNIPIVKDEKIKNAIFLRENMEAWENLMRVLNNIVEIEEALIMLGG